MLEAILLIFKSLLFVFVFITSISISVCIGQDINISDPITNKNISNTWHIKLMWNKPLYIPIPVTKFSKAENSNSLFGTLNYTVGV